MSKEDDGGLLTGNISVFDELSLTGEWEVTAVTESTVTISGDNGWDEITDQSLLTDEVYSVYDNGVYQGLSNDSDLFDDWDNITYNLYSSYNSDVGQVFDNVIGPITLDAGVTRVITNLTSLSGFYNVKNGSNKTVTIDVEFTILETDEDGVSTGESTTTEVEYTSNTDSITYSVYQTVYLDVPYTYSKIYARRLTNRSTGSSISNNDKCQWDALYTFEPVDVTDLGNVTTAHVIIPSNSQSRLTKSRKTSVDLTRLITQYLGNGEFGEEESYATDNAFQCMIHLALDDHNGRLSIDNIDADGLLSVSDEIVEYFGSDNMIRFGYAFDDCEMSYEDMFILMCSVVNCVPYVPNGVYSAFFEQPQSSSSMQITCRNKIAETETREDIFYKEYDGVELSYRSEEDGVTYTIYVPMTNRQLIPK